MTQQQKRDPTPEEIRAACLEIQATWSPAERMRRLRVDLRPQVSTPDGRQVCISPESYDAHHAGTDIVPEAMRCKDDNLITKTI